jgi:hypothetical protein
LAVRLQSRGHRLTIIAAMPNYPTGKILDAYRGRVFCVEEMHGMRVIRRAIYPSKSANKFVRLANYLSFAAASLLIATRVVGRQDLLMMGSPPLFLGLSGVPMSRLIGARLVMMVSDT